MIYKEKLMISLKRFAGEFNIKKQAQELGVSVWQSPSFLFIIMGLIIVVAMIVVYFMSKAQATIEVLVISESVLVVVLFTMGNFIIGGIDAIARANKIKTEFVSIASHQLKAPLSEVSWQAEFLTKKCNEGLNSDQLDLVKSITKSNERMTRLVNDLLDVARIDQGRIAFVKNELDIGGLIDRVVENNKILANKEGVDIEVRKSREIPKIPGDRKRTEVIVDNLISNGIKYSKEKGGKVEVFIEREGEKVEVCIKDNGIGIPKDQQSRVFEKFFRSDNATKNETEGTGLGLYIAKNFVEQSGGKMWFESDEDKGSMFCFSLPVERHDKFFSIKT